jgi:hypothetical protein
MKGIDAQIMLQRATDFARDASSQIKRPEIEASFKVLQAKAQADQLVKNVQSTERDEMLIVDPDAREKRGFMQDDAKQREKNKKESGVLDPELIFNTEGHISKDSVDIRV